MLWGVQQEAHSSAEHTGLSVLGPFPCSLPLVQKGRIRFSQEIGLLQFQPECCCTLDFPISILDFLFGGCNSQNVLGQGIIVFSVCIFMFGSRRQSQHIEAWEISLQGQFTVGVDREGKSTPISSAFWRLQYFIYLHLLQTPGMGSESGSEDQKKIPSQSPTQLYEIKIYG